MLSSFRAVKHFANEQNYFLVLPLAAEGQRLSSEPSLLLSHGYEYLHRPGFWSQMTCMYTDKQAPESWNKIEWVWSLECNMYMSFALG